MIDANSLFQSNLKFIRESKGMTQKELATLAGLHWTRISTIELGTGGGSSLATLNKLAKALNVAPHVFLLPTGE